MTFRDYIEHYDDEPALPDYRWEFDQHQFKWRTAVCGVVFLGGCLQLMTPILKWGETPAVWIGVGACAAVWGVAGWGVRKTWREYKQAKVDAVTRRMERA